MKVQFMLDFHHELVDEEKLGEIRVVATYEDPEQYGVGYEILEVEVEGIWMVKIEMQDGKVYVAEDAQKFKNGKDEFWVVTLWAPTEE